MGKLWGNRIIKFLIPGLFLGWSLYLDHLAGPFYLNRSDPEYPYLLNGLNCAKLDFSMIGHTDHPGTPFQCLTGIFLRVTHWFAGGGTLAEDVFARPEMYLAWSSFFLTVLTFIVLVWLGRIALRNGGDLKGALLMQGSVLLSPVLIDFPMRYNPDRMLVLYALIFMGLCYKLLFSKDLPEKKFVIISGVVMGVGFATKFNFLPLVVLPVIMIPKWRNWLLYGVSFLITGFISILPIIGKFSEFRRFITGVVTHDGLYGQGSEQVINWSNFFHNIGLLFKYNPAFLVILLLSVGFGLYLALNSTRRKKYLPEILLMAGFWLATLAGFIMVAKHFKNYYFGPVLAMAGFILLAMSGIRKDKAAIPITLGLAGILVLISAVSLTDDYRYRREQLAVNRISAEYMRAHIGSDDILLVEPTWMAGPMKENGLVYGISYVAHRHRYYQVLEPLYPNVITWEGNDQPLREFRTIEQDPEAMLRSGKDLYLLTTPGRYPDQFLRRIDSLAGHYAIDIKRDTCFYNPGNQDMIIRYRHTDRWRTLLESGLKGPGEVTVNGDNRNTALLEFSGVQAGDYFEATARIRQTGDEKPEIILRSQDPSRDTVFFSDSHSLYEIGNGEKLLRLRARISKVPEGGKLVCHVYLPGNGSVGIGSFRCAHYGVH
jgi:hypothetical protein